jgi:uncharacterized protein
MSPEFSGFHCPEKMVSKMDFMNAIDLLCPNCGLCCDSTLFADVELRPGDNAQQVAQFGLALAQKTRRKQSFAQPCACFDGKYCRIYSERPGQCRSFECGLLKRTGGGKIKVNTALKRIWRAKKLANKVRALLRAFGQHPEQHPLSHCYSQAMSSQIDLSRGGDVAERHSQLMRAFADLMKLLNKDFLQ